MTSILSRAQGLAVLVHVNGDRFLGLAAVLAALLTGTWLGMPSGRSGG